MVSPFVENVAVLKESLDLTGVRLTHEGGAEFSNSFTQIAREQIYIKLSAFKVGHLKQYFGDSEFWER